MIASARHALDNDEGNAPISLEDLLMTIPSTHISLLCALGEESRQEDAWAVFQAAYREVILGWCKRRGLNRDAAEDLTQEILIKLLNALPHYKHQADRGRFRSWLKTVVENVLSDHLRRQRRRPEPVGVGGSAALERLYDVPTPVAAEELSDAVDKRTSAWEAEVLDRVRARVEPASWEAFCRRMIGRRPASEVAAELGLTVGAVYKAAERIKRMVIQECHNASLPGLPG
jgi:RNA polymerase sigma-70 factor (ECF subfamily)